MVVSFFFFFFFDKYGKLSLKYPCYPFLSEALEMYYVREFISSSHYVFYLLLCTCIWYYMFFRVCFPVSENLLNNVGI